MIKTELPDIPVVKTARNVARKLREHGHRACFAGGSVRDLLMGLELTEIDIATDATPPMIQKIFSKTIPVGAKFGVMLVLERGFCFEVATFRSDEGYSDGRHPDKVSFSSLEEDVKRRDFTINGLMLDPETDEIIDLVHGREDIERGLVRAIGDPAERFREDKLRIMRGIRFAARFDFQIEENTLRAIKTSAPEINQVSAERIGEELKKTFAGPNPARALRLYSETGVLEQVLPEVDALKLVPLDPAEHAEPDAFEHTARVLENLPSGASMELALAALLHDIGKGEMKRRGSSDFRGHEKESEKLVSLVGRRLRFPNKVVSAVKALVAAHSLPWNLDMKKSVLKKILASVDGRDFLALVEADITASGKDLHLVEKTRTLYKNLDAEGFSPEPLLTGDDLKKLGASEGKRLGRTLEKIYDAQLEMEITTREEALELARRELGLK